MSNYDHFVLGDWNVICDICGFKYKGSELRKNWQGLWVFRKDWEPRPASEYVRGIKEDQTVPYSRPESTDRATTGYKQALAGATTITSADLGLDGRVLVDVPQQVAGVATVGAVTITVAASIVAGNVVVIKGVTTSGVVVTVVNNSTGTVTQIA